MSKILIKERYDNKKIKRGRRRCIICIGEINVIITYITPQAFVITKYSLVTFTSNLWKIYGWFSNPWENVDLLNDGNNKNPKSTKPWSTKPSILFRL